MGFFSSRKSRRANVQQQLVGHQRVAVASADQLSTQIPYPPAPITRDSGIHTLRPSSSETNLRSLRPLHASNDTRRQTLYLDSREQRTELTPLAQHQSEDLAGRLEELAAAHNAGIIDDEAYRILRETAFSSLAAASTVPTPKPIGHVPELDVPLLDPSHSLQPMAVPPSSASSIASKRSSSSFASVFARFRRHASSRYEPSLIKAAESDRESTCSSVAIEATRDGHASVAPGISFRRQSAALGTPMRSNSRRRPERTPPPSAYRFQPEDSTDGHGHPPLPESSSSLAWISEDATPIVIKAEIQRLELEAQRLEASFREAQNSLRREIDALQHSSIGSPYNLRGPRSQVSETANHTHKLHLRSVHDHSNNAKGETMSQSSLKGAPEVYSDTTAMLKRWEQVDRRRLEAGARYGRKIEFLSTRLQAAELRRKVRR